MCEFFLCVFSQNLDGVVSLLIFQSLCCPSEFVFWSPWIHLLLIVLGLHFPFQVERRYGTVVVIVIIIAIVVIIIIVTADHFVGFVL